jgi:hypothetical protein
MLNATAKQSYEKSALAAVNLYKNNFQVPIFFPISVSG